MTPENLAKVKHGMTSAQACDILGKPDETHSQGALGLTSTAYLDRKDSSEVKIVFLNNRVMATEGSLK